MRAFQFAKRYLPMVEIITDKTDPRCLEIYRLRHEVIVNQHKMNINPANIFTDQSGGKYICDHHDTDTTNAVVHYAIRNPNTGKYISSIRTVDGNKTKLDMEKHGWFRLSDTIKQNGVVEWSRLVSDASARKTNAALLLYIQSVNHQQDLGVDNITFMVDSKAKNLMNYYKRWTICEEISNGPVKCDEYELGRTSHVMIMPMGKENTMERVKFNLGVRVPAIFGVSLLKQYDNKKK
jgi:hypothetical protein